MPKYKVTITQTTYSTYIVDEDSEEFAKEVAMDTYFNSSTHPEEETEGDPNVITCIRVD